MRGDDVTIGVLCDGTRYDKAEDPVEWDLFRTHVLESQGWTLLRVWTPHVVRDRAAVLAAIRTEAARELAKEASAPHAVAQAPLPAARVVN